MEISVILAMGDDENPIFDSISPQARATTLISEEPINSVWVNNQFQPG